MLVQRQRSAFIWRIQFVHAIEVSEFGLLEIDVLELACLVNKSGWFFAAAHLHPSHIHSEKLLLTVNITVLEVDENTAATLWAETMRFDSLSERVGFHLAVTVIFEYDIFPSRIDQEVACGGEDKSIEEEVMSKSAHRSWCRWNSCNG